MEVFLCLASSVQAAHGKYLKTRKTKLVMLGKLQPFPRRRVFSCQAEGSFLLALSCRRGRSGEVWGGGRFWDF